MKIQDYVTIINHTAVYPRTVENFGIAYTFLGVLDESMECMDKMRLDASKEEINKEKGDIVWYLAAFCKETSLDFEKIVNEFFQNKSVGSIEPDGIIGDVKKFYRDNKVLSQERIRTFVLSTLYTFFNEESREEFDVIMQNNYDKLMKRRETNTIHGDGDNRELK